MPHLTAYLIMAHRLLLSGIEGWNAWKSETGLAAPRSQTSLFLSLEEGANLIEAEKLEPLAMGERNETSG